MIEADQTHSEDGTIDPSGSRLSGMHKLGPKANLGAINAGLRALDRSGKPCRRWTKGGFTLKTFTGVVWGVPRWTAPPKPSTADVDPDASAVPSAADSSSKENKDAADGAKQVNGNNAADTTVADVTVADADATMADTTVADATLADATVADATIAEDSNNGDVEMQSAADSVPASSPAPVAVSAAS